MYKRIEVLADGLWRGPMRAFSEQRSRIDDIYAIWNRLPGALTFGGQVRSSSRFAWTQAGWEKMGQKTLVLCREVFGPDSVRVRHLSGSVVYQDEYQVAVRPG